MYVYVYYIKHRRSNVSKIDLYGAKLSNILDDGGKKCISDNC